MFAKIAEFFIKNSKLTLVLVIVIIISGIGSYFIVPKQYNPTIIVPAFNVFVQANGLSSGEISKYIVSPLENKIMELEGIDKVYGIAGENYASVMLKFKVGEDIEKAKVKLQQKLSENLDLKPIGIGKHVITTIDPDILPQITIALTTNEVSLGNEEKYIYLRQIANILKNHLKTIENVTTIDIVGGFNEDIIVNLDLNLLESKKISILEVYSVLEKNNLNLGLGNINLGSGDKFFVGIDSKVTSVLELKKITIKNTKQGIIYLEDIAEIKKGVKRLNKLSLYEGEEAVFLGVGKSIGTNSVFLTDSVLEKLEYIKKDLPNNILINIIQNEGDTARAATNMLLVNLAQSIIIVFIVLALYLGRKDAFNTAISIPLTLGLVFLYALLAGENINRITLFALILVLGMLVDNSTVIVENISRHLKDRAQNGKTKLEAVLEGTQEVGLGVILSTLSRLFAFGAMFAVGGMMGEYMGPIPQFAIIALLISLIIAFAINPWISFLGAKDISPKNLSVKKDNLKYGKIFHKINVRKRYLDLMKLFLNNKIEGKKRRKLFKFVFWITLVVILVGPIYGGIFKARMLPKSDQNQIYLWIDAPRDWGINKMESVGKDIDTFFDNYKISKNGLNGNTISNELQIVDTVSMTIGEAFMGDFANLFRGGLYRVNENQLSARVNLVDGISYEDITGNTRLVSEEFTIKIRDLFREYILLKYPDLEIKLLEDPPGPPVRATFLAKISTDASLENKLKFISKVENEVSNIAIKQGIVDLGNSLSTTYKKLNIKIDKESLSRAGLTTRQVSDTLAVAINSIDIATVKNIDSLDVSNLVLGVKDKQIETLDLLKSISFINNKGKAIFLDSFADIEYSFVGDEINTDSREVVDHIYAEMGNNSLIYPVINLYGILMDDKFLGDEFVVESWSLYEIVYRGLKDDKQYVIKWGGEWELTMDTFRDLGIAMGLSLLVIYFLLVGQFASFRIAGIVMITFLLSFYGVFPGFSFLYLVNGEYFSATSMIGLIALGGIVVGNAIILIDYINVLKKNGLTIEDALLKAGYVRFAPIILTSLTTVFGATTIIGDPVWSGLAWAIIGGLLISSILTLIVIPIFYYESQKDYWEGVKK